MKKTVAIFFTAIAAVLGGCAYVTQEMQEDASFQGLKKIYIEEPVGTSEVFAQAFSVEDINAALKTSIADYLKTKGFLTVENKADAQIIFRAIWNASLAGDDSFNDGVSINSTSVSIPVGTTAASNLYATLEIQAILPQSGHIWSWRGFSPTNLSVKNFTIGQIYDNVVWCLQYFPPEENPASFEIIKSEKKQKKIEAEENPFKDVLVKEREKQESERSIEAKPAPATPAK